MRTIIADGHDHSDVVYVNDSSGLSCSICCMPVERVRVEKTPPRAAPRDATTTKPKKKESTSELAR